MIRYALRGAVAGLFCCCIAFIFQMWGISMDIPAHADPGMLDLKDFAILGFLVGAVILPRLP